MLTELLAFLDELLSYLESVRDVHSEQGSPARRSPEIERLIQKTRVLRDAVSAERQKPDQKRPTGLKIKLICYHYGAMLVRVPAFSQTPAVILHRGAHLEAKGECHFGEAMMTNAPITSPSNAQAEYWNSPAARPWAEQHERQDRALASLATVALDLATPQPGEHVLDIGCGSGTTVLALAAHVGPRGHVLGADISEQSVARARARIASAGLPHAEVILADVATHPFVAGSFDLAFSRLGVMFFNDPIAAFANVHRAMKPAGRLALAVFRPASENPWPSAPVAAVRHLLPPMPPPAPDEPGLFSWGDPARVQRILEGAGFREVSLTPVNLDYQLAGAGGAAEAAEFALLFGPLTRVSGLSAAQRDAVRSTLEGFFQRHATPQGVALPSAFWIVQARV